MILKLAYYGDPILRKKTAPILEITDEILELAKNMIDTMISKKGVGLAAPQVSCSLAIFVTQFPEKHDAEKWVPKEPEVFINPKILEVSQETWFYSEGCLSIPGIYEDVSRPYKIKIRAQNLKGELFEREFEGYEARVCLHENDHLNGVFFIDRLDPKLKKELEPKLRKLRLNIPKGA